MDEGEVIALIALLGLGGLMIYFFTRPAPIVSPPVTQQGLGQCGASYVGVGATLPCNLLINGVKTLAQDIGKGVQATGVPGAVKSVTSGIKPWEAVVLPVGVTHATINVAKSAVHEVESWF